MGKGRTKLWISQKWNSKDSISRDTLNSTILLRTVVTCCVLFAQTSADISNSTSRALRDAHTHTRPNHYTDQWAVEIEGGPERAHYIAKKHGFINTGEILPHHYHFVHKSLPKRSIEPCHEFHSRLSSESEVKWHAQQTVKKRVKRDYLEAPSPRSFSSRRRAAKKYQLTFTDPRWLGMWYLNRGPGLDMNVQEAWEEGITGKGIVVTILDDGLEKDHPDIVRNYDPMASFDVNSLDMDPMPTYDLTDSNRHGTRCAGEVAAEANNSICAVGIAYEAGVGGVRMLDGDVTDAVEARSLSHNPQHIDIYSASWGPDDDGKTVDGPGELATRAFVEGITKGRGGKGSIFVWASGNGGRDHDNCNCDGYTNSIWTLSISSATENGLVPWYSEACSSTLATTYSSGGTGEKQIVTIDLHHSCTSSHTGTSASAPLAAGICALALQANTNLTWRDMQHIVVRTARPQNLIAPDWATNGVGRNVSHSFGYGLMDAGAMVKLSRKWRTVPEQNKCEVRAPYTDKNIPAKSKVTLEIRVTDCPGVKFLEHVQAKVTLTSAKRGDLLIYLISPSGTRSVLLANRRHDLNRSGFTDWPFMTVHCWGENPVGKWVLEIHNEGRYAGKLQTWAVVLHGISEDPNGSIAGGSRVESPPAVVKPGLENSDVTLEFDGSENRVVVEPPHVNNPHLAASTPEVADMSSVTSQGTACLKSSAFGTCLECSPGLFLHQETCLTACPPSLYGFFRESINRKGVTMKSPSGVCLPCHYSCRSCSGDTAENCTSCFVDSTLVTRKIPETQSTASTCYPTRLYLNTIENNAFWYRVLILIIVANVSILLILIGYIYMRKGSTGESGRAWLEKKGEYQRVSPEDDNHFDEVDVRYAIPVTGSVQPSNPPS